ncbi:MAG: DUF1559 domain-containing protein, partial [Pirellulaceae bacterium]|nr:DUF1559 domain-containing protein [Pirellulaceae bacterium]
GRPLVWSNAQWNLPGLICPSTNPYSANDGVCATTYPYVTSMGPPVDGTLHMVYFLPSGSAALLGRTNYLGNCGRLGSLPGFNVYEGPFTRRSKNNLGALTDGTSNTFFFGEVTGGKQSRFGTQKFSHSWAGAGVMPSAWGIEAVPASATPGDGVLTSKHYWYKFGSEHPNIVQFTMADGAVKAIPQMINTTTFVRLSGMRDNYSASVPD